jgi:hypothetical protein
MSSTDGEGECRETSAEILAGQGVQLGDENVQLTTLSRSTFISGRLSRGLSWPGMFRRSRWRSSPCRVGGGALSGRGRRSCVRSRGCGGRQDAGGRSVRPLVY